VPFGRASRALGLFRKYVFSVDLHRSDPGRLRCLARQSARPNEKKGGVPGAAPRQMEDRL